MQSNTFRTGKPYKTKCDFCRYWTGASCRVTPNSAYCREAQDELNRYLRGDQVMPQKSLRQWDKR